MAASFSSQRRLLTTLCSQLNGALWLNSGVRSIHSTAVCNKNRAARIRVGKGDRPMTYEEALPPHQIAHRKGWLSHHTSNLNGEHGTADRTVEDAFIRRFIYGTFHRCLANELVIKRRGNMLIISALMFQKMPPRKYYFFIGYTEELLSHFYKCPVKMEIQTVEEKVVYKYL
ncbi:28S ribosomal protein S24, mitochondrial [Astyanax mexicanus]|uniref:28S ribosomal protein S24, mitochondrial n=2 Tax=Astyanax mexicanus TaxID=7994 RepID=A0A8B9KBC2_ASTMX|nr:28S ribosomal protein S24, mitochondrial [Astyanax mexicanus]KAG9263010.1 28S ribosomal protein S24, mitochondrial [Astyanax mexicanus]